MNYLQLVQRLRQECGVAGSGPTTVVAQVNEAKRLVDWVNTAWLEIQGMHDDWTFLRQPFTEQPPANVSSFTAADANQPTLREWDLETFRCYQTAVGVPDEQFMVFWDYFVFRDTYLYAQPQPPGRPLTFTVRPGDYAILVAPATDVPYTIVGECLIWPKPLVADTDVPPIDESVQMAIVYKAMEYYALYESAAEVLARAKAGQKAIMPQLERRYLPKIGAAEPLA